MAAITVIGVGKLGGEIASALVMECPEMERLNVLDMMPALSRGQALDLSHMAAAIGSDVQVESLDGYEGLSDSSLIILCAGFPRKPGMTRLDLLQSNKAIVGDIAEKIAKHAPHSMVLAVTNPLDVMMHLVRKTTKFERERVFGMGSTLDSFRFRHCLSKVSGVPASRIEATVIGEHGESMVPLPAHSYLDGKAAVDALKPEKLKEAIGMTKRSGLEVITMKGATTFGPAASVVRIVKSILNDGHETIPACAALEGEYGRMDICIGVPVVFGRGGAEKIVELDLLPEEKMAFEKSCIVVREGIKSLMA